MPGHAVIRMHWGYIWLSLETKLKFVNWAIAAQNSKVKIYEKSIMGYLFNGSTSLGFGNGCMGI